MTSLFEKVLAKRVLNKIFGPDKDLASNLGYSLTKNCVINTGNWNLASLIGSDGILQTDISPSSVGMRKVSNGRGHRGSLCRFRYQPLPLI